MTFVLDDTGRIERKIVEENYRSRYGGRWLLEELGRAPAVRDTPGTETSTVASQGIVSARAWLDSPTYFAYQRLGLHLVVTVQPAWHVYGPEVPPGNTGLRIELQSAPPGVRSGRPRWPEAKPFRVTGLDEEFSVYKGTVEITTPVDFVVNRGSGPVRLEISVGYQACSDRECLPPASLSLSLTVPEAPIP
jgi:DsbC/DsbD-like thiol-disulfide interchange protein